MRYLNRILPRLRAGLLFVAAVAVASAASAQDEGRPMVDPEEPGSKLSGFMSLDANTNFMSYGFDVWQTGNFGDLDFNPSFGLEWDFGSGFTANVGTWWDVNNNAVSSIGGAGIQEVDVWFGLGYSAGIFSASVTYQEWLYGGDSERILDFILGLDMLLSPTVTIHSRVDGNGTQETGAVFVLSGSHEFALGEFATLSPGVNVAFVTPDYYVADEGGFGYVSLGVGLGVPMTFVPSSYGDWAFQVGGYYYYTSPDNIANTDDNIFTMSFGVGVGF